MVDVNARILGAVTVLAGGRPLSLGGPQQRALFATLALHANEVVSVDRLVDCIWDDEPPASARHIVQTYVSQLRAAIAPAEMLQTRSPGYVLEVAPEQLDATRFEVLLREAREAVGVDAVVLLDRALAEWRGGVAEDVELASDARVAARRLEELRARATELRVEALLALGRHDELVHELEQLTAMEPSRERLRAHLMVALYRSGRTSDALAVYRETRRYLSTELGIEPGPDLRLLERRILEHDATLALSDERTTALRARRRRAFPRRAAAAVAGGGGILAVAVVLATGGSHTVALHPGDVAVLDASTGRPIATPVRGAAAAITTDGAAVWAATSSPRSVAEVDAFSHRVMLRVPLRVPPYALAVLGRSVWVGRGYDGTVERISAAGRASAPFRPVPRSRGRLALVADHDALWVAGQDGFLRRLEPATRRITATAHVGVSNAVAAGYGSIWVASASADQIIRVDARTGHVIRRINIGGIPASVAVGLNGVWAASPSDGNVWRISPRLDAVVGSVSPFADPAQLATAGDRIWVASTTSGALAALDQTGRVVQRVELPVPAARLAGDRRELWLTLEASDS